MSEKDETKKVCEYLDSLNLFYFAIPAVSFNKKQGGFPIGYKKGMPDLFIPSLKLFIEMKDVKPSKVKEHELIQADRRNTLFECGYYAFRCEGFEKAREVINNYNYYQASSEIAGHEGVQIEVV